MIKYKYTGKNKKGKSFTRTLTMTEIESWAFMVWVKENKIIQNAIERKRVYSRRKK